MVNKTSIFFYLQEMRVTIFNYKLLFFLQRLVTFTGFETETRLAVWLYKIAVRMHKTVDVAV